MGVVEAGAERVVGWSSVRARRRRGEKGGRWEEEGRCIVCVIVEGWGVEGGLVQGVGGGEDEVEGWSRVMKKRDG
jgi:hypothetical protein